MDDYEKPDVTGDDGSDPVPEFVTSVTDFSDVWKLGMAFAAPPMLPEPERDYTLGVMSTFGTERVEFDVHVTRRIGWHQITTVEHMVVYRTRKPEPRENRRTA